MVRKELRLISPIQLLRIGSRLVENIVVSSRFGQLFDVSIAYETVLGNMRPRSQNVGRNETLPTYHRPQSECRSDLGTGFCLGLSLSSFGCWSGPFRLISKCMNPIGLAMPLSGYQSNRTHNFVTIDAVGYNLSPTTASLPNSKFEAILQCVLKIPPTVTLAPLIELKKRRPHLSRRNMQSVTA